MNGFYLIDKAKGKTSFSCVSALRKLCDTRKVGFAGTLDPLASGLMIVAVGEATKLLPYLENLDKVYVANIKLGAISDTYDGEGKIVKGNDINVQRGDVEQTIAENFSGEQMQMPPVFSAIKVGGRRAYDAARKGEKVDLKPRRITFYSVKILEYTWPDLKVRIHCSKGTYIRSFAYDLGERLGSGAYLNELRREKIGMFSVGDAFSLEDRADSVESLIVKPDELFSDWLKVYLSDRAANQLANGGFVDAESMVDSKVLESNEKPMMAIYDDQCMGVLERTGDQLKIKRKLNIF